jgi:hypothetical protein
VRAFNPIDAIPDLSENQVLFFYGMDGVKPAIVMIQWLSFGFPNLQGIQN